MVTPLSSYAVLATGRPTRRYLHHLTGRQLNRLANGHQPSLDYVHRRTGDKADLDTIRRLKRYIAREVYPLLRDAVADAPAATPGGG